MGKPLAQTALYRRSLSLPIIPESDPCRLRSKFMGAEPAKIELSLQVAQIVPCTGAEGPGKRFALWFQGCPLRCPGCCNPEMLPFEGGQSLGLAEVLEQVRCAANQRGVEGITLLGGEPLAHAGGAAALARRGQALGLSVMVFSGYTLDEARKLSDPAVAELLALTDILVDGPYIRE